jgi:hypothetical protein
MACAAAAAVALAVDMPIRRRLLLLAAAMVLGAVLIVAENWQGERIQDLRDSPAGVGAGAGFAAAIVAGLVALFRSRPILVPLAIVATMPFRIPIDLAGTSVNLLLPLYAVLAAALVAALIEPERIVPRGETLEGPARFLGPALGLVLVAYALQASYADEMSAAVENLGFFFLPFAALFFLLLRAPWDRSLVRLALIVVVAEAALVALVAFGQYAVRDLFWNDKVISGNEAHVYFRVNSLFFDPNIMGRYLALTMVALGGVVAWGRRRESGLASIVFLMLLLALAITFSQSSMLALLAGLLVLIAGRWGIAGGLVAGVATLLVLAISIVAFGEAGITDETTGRRGLVSGGLELAEQQPVVGNGSGSFPVEFEERFGGGDGIATESHTEPITVLAEQGAVGMIPYLLLLAAAVTMLWSAAGVGLRGMRNPVGATLLATFAAMVVHSLGYAAFLTDPLTWLLLALAAVLPAMYSSAVEPGRTAAVEPQRV